MKLININKDYIFIGGICKKSKLTDSIKNYFKNEAKTIAEKEKQTFNIL
jgi:hypothetical protein